MLDNPVLLAVVCTVAGGITTGALGVFAGWWNKTRNLSLDIIKEQARQKASDDRQWEKLIMIRKVMEGQGWKIPDREWSWPGERGN